MKLKENWPQTHTDTHRQYLFLPTTLLGGKTVCPSGKVLTSECNLAAHCFSMRDYNLSKHFFSNYLLLDANVSFEALGLTYIFFREAMIVFVRAGLPAIASH